jgi:hypothetical protein
MRRLSLFAMLLFAGSAIAQDMNVDSPNLNALDEDVTLTSNPFSAAPQNIPVGLDCKCGGSSGRDRKIATFGFSFGLNRSNLQFGSAQQNGDQITNGLGYRLGLVSELRLGKRFVITPKADLSFNAGQVSQSNTDYAVSASSLELMGHLKYRFAKSNFSPYVLAGPNYRMPLNTRSDNFVPTRNDLAIDVGMGLDIPLIGFKISPEVRYSYGLTNVTNSDAFSDLNHHNIAISLIFTGK